MVQITLPDAVQTYCPGFRGADGKIVTRGQPEALDPIRHDPMHAIAEAGCG